VTPGSSRLVAAVKIGSNAQEPLKAPGRLAREAEREQGAAIERQHDHAERLAPDVRPRIERDLAAIVSRRIAAPQRGPRVRRLVQGRREQEGGEVEQPFTKIGHGGACERETEREDGSFHTTAAAGTSPPPA
jgi:hypothetical protein